MRPPIQPAFSDRRRIRIVVLSAAFLQLGLSALSLLPLAAQVGAQVASAA
jgi:hypothetical protein